MPPYTPEIIIGMALVYLAFKLGQWSVLWPLKQLSNKLKARGLDLESALGAELADIDNPQPTVEEPAQEILEITEESGQKYAWGKNGRFLAQGPDYLSLFRRLARNCPGHQFRINRNGWSEPEFEKMVESLRAVFEGRGS